MYLGGLPKHKAVSFEWMQLPWERFNIVKRLSHCAVHVKQLGFQDCKNLQQQSIFT